MRKFRGLECRSHYINGKRVFSFLSSSFIIFYTNPKPGIVNKHHTVVVLEADIAISRKINAKEFAPGLLDHGLDG